MRRFKWTSEAAELAAEMYNARENATNKEIVAKIAAAINSETSEDDPQVSERAVVHKLSHMKAYEKEVKVRKTPVDEGPTKEEILESLREVGVDVAGANGATKAFLNEVLRVAS